MLSSSCATQLPRPTWVCKERACIFTLVKMHTRVDRNIELCGIFTIQFSKLKSKKYNISIFPHPVIRKAEWNSTQLFLMRSAGVSLRRSVAAASAMSRSAEPRIPAALSLSLRSRKEKRAVITGHRHWSSATERAEMAHMDLFCKK